MAVRSQNCSNCSFGLSTRHAGVCVCNMKRTNSLNSFSKVEVARCGRPVMSRARKLRLRGMEITGR